MTSQYIITNMKELYHLCISSPNEVLFRKEDDINMCLNIIALTAFKTNSLILADSLMSNHIHLVLETDIMKSFILTFKERYFKYFNKSYSVTRSRPIFDDISFFCLKLSGWHHIVTCLSYVLHNGLHHGLASTAFGYKYSSVNEYYKDDLGKQHTVKTSILSRSETQAMLPRHSVFPDSYIMNNSGVFTRESFEEIKHVELLYSTPRTFLYYMNRISNKQWIEEQKQDNNNIDPITLMSIESCSQEYLTKMMNNERGRYNSNKKTDFDVCKIIDNEMIKRVGAQSVYFLTNDQKDAIANELMNEHIIGKNQIKRCLGL